MSETPSQLRITVAFAGAEPDIEALDGLARLAAALRAELNGLFVEDANLFRLAALPGTRIYSRTGTSSLERDEMERLLRRQAQRVRAALMQSAEHVGARWSFSTARGSLAGEIIARSSPSEAIAVGLTLHARALFAAPSFPRARARRASARPIAVLFTGTPASKRAAGLAVRLCETLRRPLTVLLNAEASLDKLEPDDRRAVAALRPLVLRLASAGLAEISRATRSAEAALIVLEAGEATLTPEAIALLSEELSCPALLVR